MVCVFGFVVVACVSVAGIFPYYIFFLGGCILFVSCVVVFMRMCDSYVVCGLCFIVFVCLCVVVVAFICF